MLQEFFVFLVCQKYTDVYLLRFLYVLVLSMFWITNMLLLWCIWAVSIGLLVYSAEKVVHVMIKIARHFWVSDTFVWLTILSIGTSLPEISSHIIASAGIIQWVLDFEIASSTVLWSNIWSNIVQQTLIVWVVILIAGTMMFEKRFLKENYIAMLVTMWVVWFLWLDGLFSRTDSAVLLLLFVMYIYFLYQQEAASWSTVQQVVKVPLQSPRKASWELLWWLLLLLLWSSITLNIVQQVVLSTDISWSLIGVISLWIASALPEMITAISWIRKKANGISMGTLIWSNIVNPLVAIGIWGVISWYYVPVPLKRRDLPMQIATAWVLLVRLVTHRNTIGKKWWFFLVTLYIGYLVVRMYLFPVD